MPATADAALATVRDAARAAGTPADAALAAWFRARPALGARQRRAIADAVFDTLRTEPLPPWVVERLRAALPASEVDAALAALASPAPLDVRSLPGRGGRASLLSDLAATGLEAAPTRFAPLGVRLTGRPSAASLAFAGDRFEVQDEGSQLVVALVDARRGAMVADFCAGAGGKTLALAQAMRGTGRVHAFDTSAARLARLAPRVERAALANVHPMALAHERDARLERFAGRFDRVLVDAPCSGVGTLRRAPDLALRLKAADVVHFAVLQRRVLDAAARLVAPGGRLIYATCSWMVEEDDAVADAFETDHPRAFDRLDAAVVLRGNGVESPDALVDAAGRMRLWPHRHGCDGFFAAVWVRAA